MPALVAAIHVFACKFADVDGRNKSGHDEEGFMPGTRPGMTA